MQEVAFILKGIPHLHLPLHYNPYLTCYACARMFSVSKHVFLPVFLSISSTYMLTVSDVISCNIQFQIHSFLMQMNMQADTSTCQGLNI